MSQPTQHLVRALVLVVSASFTSLSAHAGMVLEPLVDATTKITTSMSAPTSAYRVTLRRTPFNERLGLLEAAPSSGMSGNSTSVVPGGVAGMAILSAGLFCSLVLLVSRLAGERSIILPEPPLWTLLRPPRAAR